MSQPLPAPLAPPVPSWARQYFPVLKWAGGKRQLLPELLRRAPRRFRNYHEPFVGGGALFLALAGLRDKGHPHYSFLGDTNGDLIRTYRAIREDVVGIMARLERLAEAYVGEEERKRIYYQARAAKPLSEWSDADVAVRHIFLNKTCFNGLYRVNKAGLFNVPIGSYQKPNICDREFLLRASYALGKDRTALFAKDFAETAFLAEKDDFWYADPPYLPVSKTANFASYGKDGFDLFDHVRLRDTARALKDRGVQVLLSNADVPKAHELYAGFTIERVTARRRINRDGEKRGRVGEVLIS